MKVVTYGSVKNLLLVGGGGKAVVGSTYFWTEYYNIVRCPPGPAQ